MIPTTNPPSETLTMDASDPQCQQAFDLLQRVSKDVYSTDLQSPGLAVRLDRLERQISTWVRICGWVGSGGLVGLCGTLYLLYQVLGAVSKTGGL